MEGEAEILLTRDASDEGEFVARLVDHVVELRHVWVRLVGRDVGRHAVHVDVVLAQVLEDFAEIAERDFQVRILLPAACVV